MTCIRSIATAQPQHCYSQEDILKATQSWLSEKPETRVLFERLLRGSRTDSRRYALTLEEILSLNGAKGRAEYYADRATKLAEQALTEALSQSGLAPASVDSLVFTSCSVPVLPSIDALMVESAGLRNTVHRVPIYQQGCAGGVIGLALGERLSRTSTHVALVSVELCSLVFHFENPSPAQLVGSAIFADGAASAIIGPGEDGLTFVGSSSFLVPNTRHLLGYDIFDDGAHLRLSSELPAAVAKSSPPAVTQFLAQHNLTKADVPWWLFHPGGIRVMDMLEESLALNPDQCRWARDVLQRSGNLSSATILFVVDEFLKSAPYKDGDYVLMVGIGPGITVELVLFQYRNK